MGYDQYEDQRNFDPDHRRNEVGRFERDPNEQRYDSFEQGPEQRFEGIQEPYERYKERFEDDSEPWSPQINMKDFKDRYNSQKESKPIRLKTKPSEVPNLPLRPNPEDFHDRIENQLDFSPSISTTSEPFFATEAKEPPVYVPKTTYKYENDYQEELPVKRYDPMEFVTPSSRRNSEEFPELPPFEDIDRDFSEKSLDIPRNRRALILEPIPSHQKRQKAHQFIHVDAPHTFKAGHLRGNSYHNIKDIEEHSGPLHLQEVRTKFSL